MATRASSPPRTVLVLRTGSQPREDHERTTQEWVARRLAEALGWRYGGAFDPQRRPPPGGCYLVPDETLTCAQARHLGIRDEDDLFGGVVPHPFVASKVITHPLPGADAAAPPGWEASMAAHLEDAVLPGFSVFDPAAAGRAGRTLLAQVGPIRIKPAQARGGHGQCRVADAEALRAALATLDPACVRAHGLVLEPDLAQATTCSVGEIRVAGLRLSYLGTQCQVADRDGAEVYGGSRLRVVAGGRDALEPLARDPAERQALRHARRYDAAVQAAYPGFFASRRNYDVIVGTDAAGQRRCGVLEQSWRLGGASPAEVVALAALLRPGAAPVLEVSCHESHAPDHGPPPGAEVHYRAAGAARGPLLKYVMVEGSLGHTD